MDFKYYALAYDENNMKDGAALTDVIAAEGTKAYAFNGKLSVATAAAENKAVGNMVVTIPAITAAISVIVIEDRNTANS